MFSQPIRDSSRSPVQGDDGARLASKDIVLTVTSGRSGTKLLAVLLRDVFGLHAEHEPAPRANLALRPAIADPAYAREWLISEKLPEIAKSGARTYIETSHVYCKGFIEAFFACGLEPRFIILRRDPRAVAESLFKMNGIPERTEAGKLVLLGPSDPHVLPLPDWERYSDYQLCYWYAREIERRQAFYVGQFRSGSLSYFDISIDELIDVHSLLRLAMFIDPSASLNETSRERFKEIVSRNQNPRNVALEGAVDRLLPSDTARQEHEVDIACAPYWIPSARALALGRHARP
ncbi:hypothetical protein [uncultured Enterovirga sp.]|uniref:hypothetical protein n=1 Tax=uncultured Enterovirga sp. TaxID=2026352 RepID=UPI0035CC2B14